MTKSHPSISPGQPTKPYVYISVCFSICITKFIFMYLLFKLLIYFNPGNFHVGRNKGEIPKSFVSFFCWIIFFPNKEFFTGKFYHVGKGLDTENTLLSFCKLSFSPQTNLPENLPHSYEEKELYQRFS